MMDIQIRRLNRAGIREMSEFHRRIYRDNSTEDPPMHLLDDEEFSSSFVPPVPSSLVVDSSRRFDTQLEVGEYFCSVLNTNEILNSVLYDKGIGSWLALLYFESICARMAQGCLL